MSTLSDSPNTISTAATTEGPRATRAERATPTRSRGPLRVLLDIFSSVRLGIVLLSILFVYSSIGSAGLIYPIHPNIFVREAWVHAQIRQWPLFEMTEYEWFHWWPFNLLMLLLCANLVITTVRRIRFSVINLGVWTIHTGIIILAIGSVLYFGTKVEGDVPIVRRQVAITIDGPNGPVTGSLLAMPGSRVELDGGDGPWMFEVATIDPSWELLTGTAAGDRTYSVNVLVETPERRFMRQLLAGHPELTEDLVMTSDSQQPFQRAVRVTGERIIDPRLTLDLEYEPAEWFYLRNDLVKSWAVYLRRPGDHEWVQRPIDGLAFYNDRVSDVNHVLQSPGDAPLRLRPFEISVPAVSEDDPVPDVALRVNGYLRYAMSRALLRPGSASDPINPAIWVRIAAPQLEGAPREGREYRLLALDPQFRREDGDLLAFRWAPDEETFRAIAQPPTLIFEIDGVDEPIERVVTDIVAASPELALSPLIGPDGDTGYAYRVQRLHDDLSLSVGAHSMAIVELRTPTGTIQRWVFEDDALTRDVTDAAAADAHGAPTLVDESIRVRYRPGTGLALLTIVAGPEESELRLLLSFEDGAPTVIRLEPGRVHPLPGGLTMTVTDWYPRAVARPIPMIVPASQRIRDAGEFFSQVRVEVEGQEATFANGSPWVPFHRYPFVTADRMLRRHIYEPSRVRLADGREFEIVLSRQRLPLPAPMALDDFRLATHIGGFTGESLTIRNYTSRISFQEEDGQWSSPVEVSVNKPIEHGGLSFFQAQWDPPDEARTAGARASAGLNYTVLGVGSRRGVWVQLAGCTIAVVGMIYAFYVKPVLKRRRRLDVERMLAAQGGARRPGELPQESER